VTGGQRFAILRRTKTTPFVFQARGMELSKKVKVALDETRMLILGAQILLGFQFRGVFGDGYDRLPQTRVI
jgi:hypothetical protein